MAWPKGKPRGPRKDAALQASAPAQSVAPSRVGHNSDRAVALGRDGQELTRKRTISSDIFFIPPDIIPAGWDYQWNVTEVIGQPQTAQRLNMAENGWRPVPAERHAGMYMPEGYKGPILRDGLILEERPMILTQEAKREELAKANKQMRDQQEQLMLSKKGALGDGFSDDSKYRGVGAMARTTIAPAPDAPRPRLEIDPAQ